MIEALNAPDTVSEAAESIRGLIEAVRFVLGGSGHIAGVINPPGKSKYQYWTNRKCQKYDTAADWQADAKEHPGSWWPDWDKWLSAKSGSKVPARKIGVRKLKALEPAPGSYVLVRS